MRWYTLKNNLYFYESGSIEILYGYSSHSFPTHSHEAFCVGIVVDGQVNFSINNRKKTLGRNMMYVIPSNTAVKFSSESEYKYLTICIKNKLKDKIMNSMSFSDYYLEIDDCNKIISVCNKFKKDKDQDDFLNSILNLISDVTLKMNSQNQSSKDETILKICNYIIKHADDKFDLDALAETFFISKYHLIRIFKNSMGVTPKQYHTQAKMRVLKSQILKENSEIHLAMDLNMTDSSHMCKIFKKYMGISIKNYKKNYRHI